MVAAVIVTVLGAAGSPLAGHLVDWGMDGDLTPGVWEPQHWLTGALLTALFLPLLALPLTLFIAIAVPVSAVVAGRPRRRDCPGCGRALTPACDTCGPPPPRRPSRGDARELARTMLRVVAVLLVLPPPVILLATGIAWVQLEREEDAFGRRAQAAAATGLTSHRETSRYGSTLGWRAEAGYWSHRD